MTFRGYSGHPEVGSHSRGRGFDSPRLHYLVDAISIDDFPAMVTGRQLDKGLLTVHLTVSEPAMIRLEIRKNGNLRRQMTLARTSARVLRGADLAEEDQRQLTLRVTATDLRGASAVVEQQFKTK